jgi:hypothetical protein
MAEKQEHDISIDQTGLKTGEKLVFSRDSQGRVTEVKKESTSCWIVTAHYGDPLHPDVCLIRDARDDFMKIPALGLAVSIADKIYQTIGESLFGRWWVYRVKEHQLSLPNKISHFVSSFLLMVANKRR